MICLEQFESSINEQTGAVLHATSFFKLGHGLPKILFSAATCKRLE